MRLPYRTPRPTASTSDKTSSGCQHPVGGTPCGCPPPLVRAPSKNILAPDAYGHAQANRILQRQNLVRHPVSTRRGTPCGCPPPVVRAPKKSTRTRAPPRTHSPPSGHPVSTRRGTPCPTPLVQRAQKIHPYAWHPLARTLPPRGLPVSTRRRTPCGCPPPRMRALRRLFWRPNSDAIALQNAQANRIHQRQNLLRLPASRRGTPCGCPPPRMRALRRLFWRPNSDAIALQNAQGNRIHQRQNLLRLPASRRGTPCGCPPPVYAPLVSYFGVRIQMRLPYRTPRATASTSDKTSSGCQHPVGAPLVGALPPVGARPPPPYTRPRRLFWRPNSDAIALQNAQANRIHQRQNLLRLPASRMRTPCGCPPPRMRAHRRLFWRPNSDAICPTERPGQPHPPATKPPQAASIPYPVSTRTPCGCPPPLAPARAQKIHPYGHRHARILPPRGHPVSTRRGTPCGCPPPLVRAPPVKNSPPVST